MLSNNQPLPQKDTRTWFVVADRTVARFFESEGGVKAWRPLRALEHPEGRLKSGQLESDRQGATKSQNGNDYSVRGLSNTKEAAVHVMEVFARDISKIIEAGRVKNAYDRLVLVAPPRFLGELKNSLSAQAEGMVYRTLDQELTQLDDAALRERLRPVLFG